MRKTFRFTLEIDLETDGDDRPLKERLMLAMDEIQESLPSLVNCEVIAEDGFAPVEEKWDEDKK